jgi:PAS domain S-box-containing protein
VESSTDAIVTVSLDGNVTSWNKGAEQIFGYAEEEIRGKKVSILEPDNIKGDNKQFVEQVKKGKKIDHYEISRLKKDGTVIVISGSLFPVLDTAGKTVAISFIARDITERKRIEETLRNFENAQKKEIHHRIKNNLQVVSSLLDLQSDKLKGRKNISDSEVHNAFKESMDRVLSISLIHEELYKGNNIELLNFSQYIKELIGNLILTYQLETDISFNFDVEENIFLDTDTSIPLGLIINELITNSFKYAFSGRDEGEIRVNLHRENRIEYTNEGCKRRQYVLSVSDDGVGIPEDLEIEDLDSLGLQLVTTLVEQLDGKLELKRDNGTEFIIKFSVAEN